MRTITLELPDAVADLLLETPDWSERVRALILAAFGPIGQEPLPLIDDSPDAKPLVLSDAGYASLEEVLAEVDAGKVHDLEPVAAQAKVQQILSAFRTEQKADAA